MRKVKFRIWIPRILDKLESEKALRNIYVEGTGLYSDYIHEGDFHSWGSTQVDNGEGVLIHNTVAIVELADGKIEEVEPNCLQFIS